MTAPTALDGMARADATSATYPPAAYAWSVVGILGLTTILSFLDRQLVNLMVDPIRATMHLTDTEISFLQGPAFIIFYLLVGLPAGRFVDRSNRRNIIIVGLVTWSVMTILCGMADNFWELFAARAGVGVGEACLAPAAYSLISDYFEPRLRGRAIALIVLSGPLGSGLSFVFGGVMLKIVPGVERIALGPLGEFYGWQFSFVAAGLPGIALALLLLLVREVPRQDVAAGEGEAARPPLLPFLRKRARPLSHLLLANGLIALAAYAVASWKASFYIRSMNLEPSDVGLALGVTVVVGALAGGLLGGIFSDMAAISGRRGGRILVLPTAALLCVPVLVAWVLTGNLAVSLALLVLVHLLLGVGVASVPSALNDIVPNRLRGQLIAIMTVVSGVLGAGLGPVSIALASEHLLGGSLSHALLIVPALACALACLIAASGRGSYEQARLSLPAPRVRGDGRGTIERMERESQ